MTLHRSTGTGRLRRWALLSLGALLLCAQVLAMEHQTHPDCNESHCAACHLQHGSDAVAASTPPLSAPVAGPAPEDKRRPQGRRTAPDGFTIRGPPHFS